MAKGSKTKPATTPADGTTPGDKPQTTPPKRSGAAKDAAKADLTKPLWGSQIPIGEAIKNLPPSFAEGVKNKQFEASAEGIGNYLIKGGVDPLRLIDLARSPEGVMEALSLASSPQFKLSGNPGVESNVAGASNATDLAEKKPRKPFKPLSGKKVEELVGGAVRGAGGPGDLKRIELKQTRDGVDLLVRNRRKAPGEGGEAAAAAQGGTAAGAAQGQQTQQQAVEKPDPTTPEGREAILEEKRSKYREKGQVPPSTLGIEDWFSRNKPNLVRAGLGTLGLGALGVGIGVGMGGGSSGQQGQPQQAPLTPEDKEALRKRREQLLYGAPPAAPQQPAPQQNPAGVPPSNNSTLLMRLQQSRMV